MTILDSIMKPGAIAVVGASTKPNTIGSDLLKRLIEYGFTGKIYPVNPKGGVIEGLQAYPSVRDIPGDVDLAIIVVKNVFVLPTIDQCHEKGIKGLCIISAGFKEAGEKARNLKNSFSKKCAPTACAAWAPTAWASSIPTLPSKWMGASRKAFRSAATSVLCRSRGL